MALPDTCDPLAQVPAAVPSWARVTVSTCPAMAVTLTISHTLGDAGALMVIRMNSAGKLTAAICPASVASTVMVPSPGLTSACDVPSALFRKTWSDIYISSAVRVQDDSPPCTSVVSSGGSEKTKNSGQ